MLYALRKDTDELCLCPYCGALLQLDSHTTELDHVMPRHLWSYYRDLVAFKIKIQGPYRNYRRPEDSPKNLIYCCSTCNKRSRIYSAFLTGSTRAGTPTGASSTCIIMQCTSTLGTKST